MQVAGGARPIAEVGEFGLIASVGNILAASRVKTSGMRLGIGDDAAIWRPRAGRSVAVSTDMLVEGVHFRRDWSDASSIGHRALAVNLSDLAAMGARPRVAVIAMSLRPDDTDRWVFDFYRGAMALGQRCGVRIIGGDFSSTPNGSTISVTVLGELISAERTLRRDAAQPGDIIAVTGPLGLAASGVRALASGRTTIDGSPTMLAAHRTPQPRILQGLLLVRAGVRAAMDLSDGLFGDLPKMCAAGNVSAEVRSDYLPIPQSVRWNFPDWFDLATRGGEDFELLFAAPPEVFERVGNLFQRWKLPRPIRIGQFQEPKADGPAIVLRKVDLSRETVAAGAFDHFAVAG